MKKGILAIFMAGLMVATIFGVMSVCATASNRQTELLASENQLIVPIIYVAYVRGTITEDTLVEEIYFDGMFYVNGDGKDLHIYPLRKPGSLVDVGDQYDYKSFDIQMLFGTYDSDTNHISGLGLFLTVQ